MSSGGRPAGEQAARIIALARRLPVGEPRSIENLVESGGYRRQLERDINVLRSIVRIDREVVQGRAYFTRWETI